MSRLPITIVLLLVLAGCDTKPSAKNLTAPTDIGIQDKVLPEYFDIWDVGLLLPHAIQWHSRSMVQYHALQPVVTESEHGIVAIDYDLTVDRTNLEHLMPSEGFLPATLPGLSGFFYTLLPPEYYCNVALAWSFDSTNASIAYVRKLKGVEEIVLFDNPHEQVLTIWRKSFPAAKVFTAEGLGLKNPMDGGMF